MSGRTLLKRVNAPNPTRSYDKGSSLNLAETELILTRPCLLTCLEKSYPLSSGKDPVMAPRMQPMVGGLTVRWKVGEEVKALRRMERVMCSRPLLPGLRD